MNSPNIDIVEIRGAYEVVMFEFECFLFDLLFNGM